MRRGEYRSLYGLKAQNDGSAAGAAVVKHVAPGKPACTHDSCPSNPIPARRRGFTDEAESIARGRACRELAESMRSLLEECPAGVSSHGHLTATIVTMLFEAEGLASRRSVSDLTISADEAKMALSRLRAVNASFSSSLDYVRVICARLVISVSKNTACRANRWKGLPGSPIGPPWIPVSPGGFCGSPPFLEATVDPGRVP